jgi:hypothetical protein
LQPVLCPISQCSGFKPFHLRDHRCIGHISSISHNRVCGFQSERSGFAHTLW